jgi:hypothetical protein
VTTQAGRDRHRRALVLVAAYALVTLIFTWPYVNYADFAGASYGGDQRLVIWTLAWDNHALLTGKPLFQANIFFPAAEALRYNEHMVGLSLFTLPLAAAGASPILAHHLVWWLAFLLNGLAAFALIQRFVRNRPAAFTGSLAFACSFYVMLHAHGHLHQIWLWPLPHSLLLLERWFDVPSLPRVLMWTVVVLIEALTSWYLAVFVLLINAMFGAILLAAGEARAPHALTPGLWRRRAVHLAAAAVVLASCVYPFAARYGAITSVTTETASFSADTASYVIPPANTVIGRWWRGHVDDRPRSPYGEQTLFAGWSTLALSLAGLVTLVRARSAKSVANAAPTSRLWLFPLLAAVGVLLSFGPALPVVGRTALAPFNWLAAIPGLDGIRVPARFAVVATLGFAGLAGIGAAALARRLGTIGAIVPIVAVPVMLLESFVVDFPGGKPESHRVPAIYRVPQLQSARSLVSLPDYRARPDWFLGGDYLFYSTEHWIPIVNGFGRTEPPNHAAVVETVRRFPESIAAMRELGIQFVVVHADRLPDRGHAMIEAARANPGCRLVALRGSDYLFEIL